MGELGGSLDLLDSLEKVFRLPGAVSTVGFISDRLELRRQLLSCPMVRCSCRQQQECQKQHTSDLLHIRFFSETAKSLPYFAAKVRRIFKTTKELFFFLQRTIIPRSAEQRKIVIVSTLSRGSQRGSEQAQILKQSLRCIRPPLTPPNSGGGKTNASEGSAGFGVSGHRWP